MRVEHEYFRAEPKPLSAYELSILASPSFTLQSMPVGSIDQDHNFHDLDSLAERLLDHPYYWETNALPPPR
jgi:hypothetical protein